MRFKRQSQPERLLRNGQDRQRIAVFSYYGSAADAQAHDSVRRSSLAARALQRRRELLVIGLALFGGLAVYNATLSPRPQLVTAQSVLPYRSVEEYTAGTESILAGAMKYRFKPTINTLEVAEQLQKRYPELVAVRLHLPVIGRQAQLFLTVRQPVLLMHSPAGLHVVDEAGRLAGSAADIAAEYTRSLPEVYDQSGLVLQKGDQALTGESVRYITGIKSQLEAKQIAVTKYVLPLKALELHVYPADAPYYVKFDMSADVQVSAGAYLAAREELAAKGVVPAEYIDVRVDEKVFYK